MTIWHWVRHGPTHARNFVGWRDLPADLGDAALVKSVRELLPEKAPIISSDLQRAVQTADALGTPHRRLPHTPAFREFHFGSWDGQAFDRIRENHPELGRAYWENPGDLAPPGGESWNMAAHRVSTMADHLTRHHATPEIIAVAHIGVILTQVQRALGITAAETISRKIDNLSVTSIDMQTGRLLRFNHLP